MEWRNTETPTFAGNVGTTATKKPAVVERLEAVDREGNVLAAVIKAVDGTISFEVDGEALGAGGSVSLATPTGDVDGVNDEFVFASPPIVVFRNGVNETRLGTIATNTFTFDTPPETGDDIEGLV